MKEVKLFDVWKYYTPKAAQAFNPDRIVVTKESVPTPQRRALIETVCALYPAAEVVECLDTSHNRVSLGAKDPLEVHRRGKRTLVFGEHKSAVRFSNEEGNTCPNYWHFSPYGFCPHGCHYCYLAGTPGVRFSPTVKIFLNIDEILSQVDEIAQSGLMVVLHHYRATVMAGGSVVRSLFFKPVRREGY